MPGRSESTSEPCRDALRTVAALGALALQDASIVFGDTAPLQNAVQKGHLILEDGALRPATEELGMEALAEMDPADRQLLHAELSGLALDAYVVARQKDLSLPPGHDHGVAAYLADVAAQAERLGHVEEALDLWARSAARTPEPAAARFDRDVTVAEHANATGRFNRAANILLDLRYDRASCEQMVRALDALETALYVSSGVETVRSRLQQIRQSLPPTHPGVTVLDVHLAGNDAGFESRARDLEKLLPQLEAGNYPARLRYGAMSKLLFAKVNAGEGLDARLLETMRRLQPACPELLIEDTPDALEAMLAYQVDDVDTTNRLVPHLLAQTEVHGEMGFLDVLLVHAAQADIVLGRFSSARDRLERSERIGLRPLGSPVSVRARGLLALESGNGDDFRDAVALPHTSGLQAVGRLTRVGLQGLSLARMGHYQTATEYLQECLDLSAGIGIAEPGRRMWVDVELALAYVHTGQVGQALQIAANLSALAQRSHRTLPEMQANRIRAFVAAKEGRPTEQTTFMWRCLLAAKTVHWFPEQARLLVDAYILTPTMNPSDDFANRLFRGTQDVLGILEDGTARQALLRASKPTAPSLLAVLTSAELRVAEVIASGMSNKAASQELFLSVRTIEAHLSSIYRKLGVKSRTHLLAVMNQSNR